MPAKKLISIIIPCHNEEENIQPITQEIDKHLSPLELDYEIIFVDDGSNDNTYLEAKTLTETNDKVKFITLSRSFGKEAALTAALDSASGDAAVPMDADFQDPPATLPEMIEKWQNGADVVFAIRSDRQADSFFKRAFSTAFYKIIKVLTKGKIKNNAGDFCLIDRKVVEVILGMKEKNRFFRGIISWVGFKREQVYFKRPERVFGETKYNFAKSFDLAIDGLFAFSVKPIRFVTLIGLATSFISLLYVFYLVVKTMLLGVDVPGYASIMTAILFIGGVQLICLGVVGEYVDRVYKEVRNRPLYLVSKKFGFSRKNKSEPMPRRPRAGDKPKPRAKPKKKA